MFWTFDSRNGFIGCSLGCLIRFQVFILFLKIILVKTVVSIVVSILGPDPISVETVLFHHNSGMRTPGTVK